MPRRRGRGITRSLITHWMGLTLGLGLALCVVAAAARAYKVAWLRRCSASDTFGSDSEQMELPAMQAAACVREGKPAGAVALFSGIIRRAPTDVIAYVNRGGGAQAAA